MYGARLPRRMRRPKVVFGSPSTGMAQMPHASARGTAGMTA